MRPEPYQPPEPRRTESSNAPKHDPSALPIAVAAAFLLGLTAAWLAAYRRAKVPAPAGSVERLR